MKFLHIFFRARGPYFKRCEKHFQSNEIFAHFYPGRRTKIVYSIVNYCSIVNHYSILNTILVRAHLPVGFTGFLYVTPFIDNLTSFRSVVVPVPAGIEDGQTVRMPVGKKEVFITFRVHKSQHFRREGSDVHTDAKISLTQAILGGRIRLKGNITSL